jgi:hypothetical protein
MQKHNQETRAPFAKSDRGRVRREARKAAQNARWAHLFAVEGA